MENNVRVSTQSDLVFAAGFMAFGKDPPYNNIVKHLLLQTFYGQGDWTSLKEHDDSRWRDYEAALSDTKKENELNAKTHNAIPDFLMCD